MESVSNGLPLRLRNAIEAFQQYIAWQYRTRTAHWPQSRSLIQDIAKECGRYLGSGQMIDPVRLAAKLEIKLEFRSAATNKVCGRITPIRGGFRATIFGIRAEPRTRFTIAHECGHSFFYSLNGPQPERIIPHSYGADSQLSRREEGLCDAFAGELLLPEASARSLAGRELGIGQIVEEASRRGVSAEVIIHRVLYEMKGWPTTVFYSIRQTPDGLDIHAYRGTRRRNDHSTFPTAAVLCTLLHGQEKHSIPSTVERIFRNTQSSQPEIWMSRSSVWVKV